MKNLLFNSLHPIIPRIACGINHHFDSLRFNTNLLMNTVVGKPSEK